MRRELHLPEEDVRALDASGLSWETVALPTPHLLIHDHPLPSGYNVATATALVWMNERTCYQQAVRG